ncbi:class I SAM-dependent methyltransferase [Halovivax cerinus]|uniref:Class I SAM-dependent methyltransferase n=1 Tax=Halovivax cerinus TaxID=1487865 RepID=A0ABD5NTR0_9EURY|nr:class I SAM-dependent methyltransferase [Halovivax cerinus]
MGRGWERVYDESDYDRRAYLGGEEMVDCLSRFVDRFGPFEDVVSVGCGPAVVPFALAERRPSISITGLDAAEPVVTDNRDLAAERGLENLSFAVDTLPDLDVDRQFDLVYCVATLYFVREAERAVERLFEHVRPGGYLVLNYPNERTRSWARENGADKTVDFSLVAEGENVLSRDGIGRLLGAEPRDYWTAVDAADADFATSDTPMVYVERPDDGDTKPSG